MDLRRLTALALLAFVTGACAGQASLAPSTSTPPSSPPSSSTPSREPTSNPTSEPTETPIASPTDQPIAEETPPPIVCPDFLPSMPIRVADLTSIEPDCWHSMTVILVGYVAPSPALGWEAPGVEPGWMIYPTSPIAVWQAKPVDYGCGSTPECPWIFVHFAPHSTLSLGTKGRWVKLTGHFNDPAAATCHYVYPSDWPATDHLPDSDAQHWCAGGFVVEQIETTAAPAS